jgi:hypothetical protein
MKALSFRQPWAELILQGRKTLDLRTYTTHYRGPLAVHASQTIERQACLQHGLDPDHLATGGLVGVVELVDVVPLTETEYAERRAEHLGGRSFREGMYGWVLRDPQRLHKAVPARGRMSLFNVDLDLRPDPTPQRTEPSSTQDIAHHVSRIPSHGLLATDRAFPGDDHPFELLVKPVAAGENSSGTTDYVLTLRQRVVHPPQAQQSFYGRPPATMTHVVTLGGDSLRAVSDHVLDALREAGYKATDLSPARRAPFHLPEAVGVRLGLVFLAVKPLSKLDRIEAISQGIRHMTLEELYYWYSKCTASDTAERAQKALRVLLAAE